MCGARGHEQTDPDVWSIATHVDQRGLDVGVVGEGHDLVDVATDGFAADRQGQLHIGERFQTRWRSVLPDGRPGTWAGSGVGLNTWKPSIS